MQGPTRVGFAGFVLVTLVSGCAGTQAGGGAPGAPKKLELKATIGQRTPRPPESPALHPPPPAGQEVAIVGATIFIGNGSHLDDGTLLLNDGKIVAIGPRAQVTVPSGAQVVDAKGKFVTPGLIDTHSHLGVYASPNSKATADGNEMTDPTTPYVFSEHSFWPQDPGIERAVAGGITTIQVLPGSGNVIGGRSVTLKLRPETETRALRFPGAPNGLKMACGENPKRVYGDTNRQPMSRMGNIFKLRQMFIKARGYQHMLREYERDRVRWDQKYAAAKAKPDGAEDPGPEPYGPDRDLGLETLADVLDGKVLVHIHCYRADEMLQMIALSRELGFKISSFHHAVEAYKIGDVLAKEGIGASLWADWWGFKLEAWDGIEENLAMVAAAGGRSIVHSDSPVGIQRLNQEAGKALNAGRRAGIKLSDDQAIQWITLNPARALGIDGQTGSLEKGKMADVVIWDHAPLSIYAAAQQVYSDGRLIYDRATAHRWSDFDVGWPIEEGRP